MVPTKMTPLILLLVYNIVLASASNSSLTFVIDDSKSMEDDIRQVRRGARDIMDIVLNYKSSQIKDIVLVTFNDPVYLNTMKVKTRDPDELQTALNSIKAHNIHNHDWPEYSLSGIELALQESHPNSYLFVFTDASAKDFDKVDLIKSMCQKAQTQIVFILTDYCPSNSDVACIVYHDIATACSGQVFIVDKNDISQVLKYVKETVKGDKTVIKTIQTPRNVWTKVEFEIDDKTEYALISVSGQNVRIANPIGFHNAKTVMSTPNAKAYRLENPTPGKYGFHVVGTSQVSVMIFSRTDFVFDHGFSKMIPKSLSDTTKQPIADERSYLSISVTDPDHEVRINNAQILDTKDKILHNLTLRRISENFYIADQFVSPNELFQIAVMGTVKSTGKPIRRLAKTPIEPQKPKIKPIKEKVPVLTITEGPLAQVAYNGTLQLTCIVSAYPAPQIIWKDQDGKLLPSQSSSLELPYDYISYLIIKNVRTNGTSYKCIGSNKLSSYQSTVQVSVLSPFNVTGTPPATINARYEKEAMVQCKITSSSRMRIAWFRTVNKEVVPIHTSDKYTISFDGTDLKINNVSLDSAGQYTCQAVLTDDPSQHREYTTYVKITDLVSPMIQNTKEVIAAKVDTPVSITCKVVRGHPRPQLTWQFKGKGSDKFIPLQGVGEQLKISKVALTDAGIYQCIAKNIIAEDKVITQLIVEAPPTIILEDGKTTYTAVEGDAVLRVPCNAIGYPNPQITWSLDGNIVKPDEKISIDGGVLVIKNPVPKDKNTYKCEAKNKFGTASQEFDVFVTEYLLADESFGDSHNIYLLNDESRDLKCNLSRSDKDTVRWYLNGIENATGAVYHIKYAKQKHDGNYTCRVNTNLGSVSETYEVDVGYPPSFMYGTSENIDWDGDDKTVLDCKVDAKPWAEVKWLYNGKVIDTRTKQLSFNKWGDYECEVFNPHGIVKRKFNVFSTECLIKTTLGKNTPLMLSEESTWPKLKFVTNTIVVKSGQKLKMSCNNHNSNPNHFQKFSSKSEVLATCDKQDDFIVDGKSYKLFDLECEKVVSPDILETGIKCLYENSEMIEVGFNLDHFVEAYKVCYDKENNVPLYAHVELINMNSVSSAPKPSWFQYPGIGIGRQHYSCEESSSPCYSKSQLVSARDVRYGPAQRSTFLDHLNSIALWNPSGSRSNKWHSLENDIREALEDDPGMTVWSGASRYVRQNGLTVPRYLWKVIIFSSGDSVAVVYINGPSPTKSDVLCNNICARAAPPGLSAIGTQYTDNDVYCCEFASFYKAFELPEDIFTTNRH